MMRIIIILIDFRFFEFTQFNVCIVIKSSSRLTFQIHQFSSTKIHLFLYYKFALYFDNFTHINMSYKIDSDFDSDNENRSFVDHK